MTQDAAPGFLGGIIKSIKVGEEEHNVDLTEVHNTSSAHLESLYSSPPFSKPSAAVMDDQDIMELNIGSISFAPIISFLPHPLLFLTVYYVLAQMILKLMNP